MERECSTLSRMVHTSLVFLAVVCSPLFSSPPPPHAVAAGQKQTYFLEGEKQVYLNRPIEERTMNPSTYKSQQGKFSKSFEQSRYIHCPQAQHKHGVTLCRRDHC